MFDMARLVSRLSVISVKTGTALPFFSWSLFPPTCSSDTAAPPTLPQEIPFVEAVANAETQDLRLLISTQARSGGKNVFFMGEHHQQPRVLAAQMTILDELIKIGKSAARPVVVITEQFNILQQGMLDRFGAIEEMEGGLGEREAAARLMDDYTGDQLGEGFDLSHYMPLLLFARESRARVLGGFPPRAWARVVSKEGIEGFRTQHGEELEERGFKRWEDLHGSKEHAAYIQSLVKGAPPSLLMEDDNQIAGHIEKGLYPAQTFKDAMLAFVIDEQVDASEQGTPLILVITGSGHCEYGFGAPERIRATTRLQMSIITCKSIEESTVWKGQDWGQVDQKDDRIIADAVFLYDQV